MTALKRESSGTLFAAMRIKRQDPRGGINTTQCTIWMTFQHVRITDTSNGTTGNAVGNLGAKANVAINKLTPAAHRLRQCVCELVAGHVLLCMNIVHYIDAWPLLLSVMMTCWKVIPNGVQGRHNDTPESLPLAPSQDN